MNRQPGLAIVITLLISFVLLGLLAYGVVIAVVTFFHH